MIAISALTLCLACQNRTDAEPEGPRALPVAVQEEADEVTRTLELALPEPEFGEDVAPSAGALSTVARGFLRYAVTAQGECTVALPAEIDAALTAWNRDFRLWRQVDYESSGGAFGCSDDRPPPFAVAGDFNADDMPDVVVHGYDRQQSAFVAITSDPVVPGGYTLAVLEAYAVPPLEGGRPRLPEYAVDLAPPRRTTPCMPDEEPPVDLTADNLYIGLVDKPGETFYMERGIWKRTYEGC